MMLDVLIVLILILLNGLLAMGEMAVVASRKAASWWLALSNARRWRPQGGKDANDMLQAGSLRAWIESGLSEER